VRASPKVPTAAEILAKVGLVQAGVEKLVDDNAKYHQ